MTMWDWIRSAIIFVAAVFIFNNFFISLTVLEAIILTLFLGVCVFHIIDIRDDFMKKLELKRQKRENGTHDNGG